MKQFFLVMAVALVLGGCSKDEKGFNKEDATYGALHITISTLGAEGTKSTVSGTEDNTINTLDLFVFSSSGALDTYERIVVGDDLADLNFDIKTKSGASKQICVIANSHMSLSDFNGITSLDGLKGVCASLLKENLKDFSMSGCATADVNANETESVTLTISRLVARVCLAGITADFSGTPYEGMPLTDVEAFLMDVSGAVSYVEGKTPATPVIINHNALVPSDFNGALMSGIVYDKLSDKIDSSGYKSANYFYCFENLTDKAKETTELRSTRLVVKGVLDGKTYYYPIPINQEGYGYKESTGFKGVKRNTSYTIAVVIRTPGSDDPSADITNGSVSLSINISDWSSVDDMSVDF